MKGAFSTGCYGKDWQLLEEEKVSDGTTLWWYVWGTQYIDDLVMRADGTATTDFEFQVLDARNNVVARLDDGGAPIKHYQYSGYGVPREMATNWLSFGSVSEDLHLFQGRQFHKDHEQYDYRNRWMDSDLGRFVSRDPIGIWGDPGAWGNGMGFVGGDPIGRRDSLGLHEIDTPEDLVRELERLFGADPAFSSCAEMRRLQINIYDAGAEDWVRRWAEQNAQVRGGEAGVHPASDADDVRELLRSLPQCSCLERVDLFTHGSEDSIEFGGESTENIHSGNYTLFPDSGWCPDCQIRIHGCFVARDGGFLARKIARHTGCTVYANRGAGCFVDNPWGIGLSWSVDTLPVRFDPNDASVDVENHVKHGWPEAAEALEAIRGRLGK